MTCVPGWMTSSPRFSTSLAQVHRSKKQVELARSDQRYWTYVVGKDKPADLVGSPAGGPLPADLEVVLPEYDETLRPTYAVPEVDSVPGETPPWLMLIRQLEPGSDLDATIESDSHRWQASPQARFERLLRETRVPIGLLSNGTHLRLVYAPRGESSGHLTFPVRAMTEVAGRPIFAALVMLLGADRLFTNLDDQRLPALLAKSRKYQNLVSTKLSDQVLEALYELLRGFQAADDVQRGELLRAVLRDDPDRVYAAFDRALAAGVLAVRRGPRARLRRRGVREVLCRDGTVRAAPRRCRAIHRHNGPPLRGMGATTRPVPADP